MLEPKSNPTYYKDLLRELEEAPKRSWFGRIAKRLGGMIRLT
jgi:cytochrome b pre-mRNA-processing protein 6